MMEVRFDSSGREIKSNKAWREECESLRQQFAECERGCEKLIGRPIPLTEWQKMELQLATVTKERDELVEALKQFAECDLNNGNCASLEVATRRIRSLAQATLVKLGADKGEKG